MKTISSAIFYMSEWQAIFQCAEYSFSEACPYQDIPAMIRYSRGLREQLAKLLFVGSNPTRISIWCLRLIGEDASLSSL